MTTGQGYVACSGLATNGMVAFSEGTPASVRFSDIVSFCISLCFVGFVLGSYRFVLYCPVLFSFLCVFSLSACVSQARRGRQMA
jgi:hypothetical protein